MNRLFTAHRRARERGRAFTLLELIVVIVILGILALLAIPTFQHVITKSKKVVLTQNAEAVLRNAEADAALGIQAAGPVDLSLLPAAQGAWEHSSTPGSPTAFQPPSDGIAIWAQDGSASSPGTIEAYDSSWDMCVALQVPPTLQDGSAPPATARRPQLFSWVRPKPRLLLRRQRPAANGSPRTAKSRRREAARPPAPSG